MLLSPPCRAISPLLFGSCWSQQYRPVFSNLYQQPPLPVSQMHFLFLAPLVSSDNMQRNIPHSPKSITHLSRHLTMYLSSMTAASPRFRLLHHIPCKNKDGKGNDVGQRAAVKSIGWKLALALNYLPICRMSRACLTPCASVSSCTFKGKPLMLGSCRSWG